MKFHLPSIIRYYIRYMVFLLLIIVPLFMFILFYISFYPHNEEDELFLMFFICALLIAGVALFYFAFLEKCFSYLIICEDVVTWKCPLRKSISIALSDCYEIGLEYEDAYAKNVYAYIFFTAFPYSADNSKYYGKVKSQKGLIKFRYTNKLAKYVITNYPNKVSYSLSQYYRVHKKYKGLF